MGIFFRASALVAAAAVLSCGNSGTQPGVDSGSDVVPPTYTNVVVDPPDVTLNVPVGGSVTQVYKAYADTSGQTHVEVTASCAFTVVNTSLGSFSGATFTSASLGGTTQVTATCGGAQGTGKLTLVLSGWVSGLGRPRTRRRFSRPRRWEATRTARPPSSTRSTRPSRRSTSRRSMRSGRPGKTTCFT